MSSVTPATQQTTRQRYALQGAVDMGSFQQQRAAGEAAIKAALQEPGKALQIDLRELEAANSLGVALMTAWFRMAESLGCDLKFAPLPEDLQLIVDFSGLSDVLPLTTQA